MYTNAGCSRLVDYYFVVSCDERGIEHIKDKLHNESLSPQTDREKAARHANFALKPKIVDRYPESNHIDTPLLPWVARTSMPRGVRARTRPPSPAFFTFVGWNIDCSKLYGACLTVFEKIHIKNQYQTVYIPKTLGFLSHYPYFCAFDVFLRCLWHVIPKKLIPLENLLVHYFYDIPAPAPSRKIAYDLGQMKVLLACRNEFDVPILELPMETTFTQLSKDRICFILKLLLLEKRVIFICGDMHQLTPVCELFVSLLFPLRWKHLYMPLLSRAMFQSLMLRKNKKSANSASSSSSSSSSASKSHNHHHHAAPDFKYRDDAPFIVGLPRFLYLNPEIQNNMPKDSYLVLLDRNQITDYKKNPVSPADMKAGHLLPNLPTPLDNNFRDAIHTLSRILTMQVDGAANAASASHAAASTTTTQARGPLKYKPPAAAHHPAHSYTDQTTSTPPQQQQHQQYYSPYNPSPSHASHNNHNYMSKPPTATSPSTTPSPSHSNAPQMQYYPGQPPRSTGSSSTKSYVHVMGIGNHGLFDDPHRNNTATQQPQLQPDLFQKQTTANLSTSSMVSTATTTAHNSMFISREYTLQAFRTMFGVMAKLLWLSAHHSYGNVELNDAKDGSNSNSIHINLNGKSNKLASKTERYTSSKFIVTFRSTQLFQSFYRYYQRINGDKDPSLKRVYSFFKDNEGHGKHFARRTTQTWEKEPFDRVLYDKEIFRIDRQKMQALETHTNSQSKLKNLKKIAAIRSKKFEYPTAEFAMLDEVRRFLRTFAWKESRHRRNTSARTNSTATTTYYASSYYNSPRLMGASTGASGTTPVSGAGGGADQHSKLHEYNQQQRFHHKQQGHDGHSGGGTSPYPNNNNNKSSRRGSKMSHKSNKSGKSQKKSKHKKQRSKSKYPTIAEYDATTAASTAIKGQESGDGSLNTVVPIQITTSQQQQQQQSDYVVKGTSSKSISTNGTAGTGHHSAQSSTTTTTTTGTVGTTGQNSSNGTAHTTTSSSEQPGAGAAVGASPVSTISSKKKSNSRRSSKSTNKSKSKFGFRRRQNIQHAINHSNSTTLDITDQAMILKVDRFCEDLMKAKDDARQRLDLCLEIERKIQEKIKQNELNQNQFNDAGSIDIAAKKVGFTPTNSNNKDATYWRHAVYGSLKEDVSNKKVFVEVVHNICGATPQYKQQLTLLRSVVELFDEEMSLASGSVRSIFLRGQKSAYSESTTTTESTEDDDEDGDEDDDDEDDDEDDEEDDDDEDDDDEDEDDEEWSDDEDEDDEKASKKKKKKTGKTKQKAAAADEDAEESGSDWDESESTSTWPSEDNEFDQDEENGVTWGSTGKFTKLDEFQLQAEEEKWLNECELHHNDLLGNEGIQYLNAEIHNMVGFDFADDFIVRNWKKAYKKRLKEKQQVHIAHSTSVDQVLQRNGTHAVTVKSVNGTSGSSNHNVNGKPLSSPRQHVAPEMSMSRESTPQPSQIQITKSKSPRSRSPKSPISPSSASVSSKQSRKMKPPKSNKIKSSSTSPSAKSISKSKYSSTNGQTGYHKKKPKDT